MLMETGIHCSWPSFVVHHKSEPGHCGSGKGFVQGAAASPLTLLKQHHQSSISCHSLKLRSEQIHVRRKGHILPCAFAQLNMNSLPVTLCQETAIPLYSPSLWLTESMRRSHMTSSTPRTLVTWVGPPTSITQLSVLTIRQTYLGSCQVS